MINSDQSRSIARKIKRWQCILVNHVQIHRAYKTRLNPTNKQVSTLFQHAGAARWSFNWALDRVQQAYEASKSQSLKPEPVNAYKLHKELVTLKQTKEYSWLYSVSKCVAEEAVFSLEQAFKNYFRRNAKRPRFKSRHKSNNSFSLTGVIRVEDSKIKLPVIGWVKLKEKGYIPKDKKILRCAISERAGHWYVSVMTQEELADPTPGTNGVIGIDVGVKTLATCSDGTVYDNPRALNQAQAKIKTISKKLNRQEKGSQNRKKTKVKLAKAHKRANDIRLDAIHKMTTEVVRTKRPKAVVIEDLNVKGMMKNHKLARSISDAAFGEIRRQLQYKCLWCGTQLIIADRFFPSSKMCSRCGCVKDNLTLKDRVYQCDACGFTIDRDSNASKNLEQYYFAAGSAVNACGDLVSLVRTKAKANEARRKRQACLVQV